MTIHYNYSGVWRVCLLQSMMLFILSRYITIPFYYIHYFLFIGGIIAYFFNFTRYAEMGKESLKIYTFFPFILRNEAIKWDNILKIAPSTIVRKKAVGGKFGGPLAPFKRHTASVHLKRPLKNYQRYSFKKNNKRFFRPTIEVRNEGLEIVLIRRPGKGYADFFADCSPFTVVEGMGKRDHKNGNRKIVMDIVESVLASLVILLILFLLYR